MYKDIFLSHAWGNDSLNRNNHIRVKILANLLINKGYTVWLDETDLIGNIDNSIIKGITNCEIVLLCLTEQYCNKINNSVYENKPNDNCYKEWNFCLFKNKSVIPVIMEPKMEEIFLKTDGVIQMYLNNLMYINFSDDNENDFPLLCKTLRQYNIYNRDEKNFFNIKPNSSFDKLKDLLQLSPVRRRPPSPLTIIIPIEKKERGFFKYLYLKLKEKKKKHLKLKRSKSKVLTDFIDNKKSVIQI